MNLHSFLDYLKDATKLSKLYEATQLRILVTLAFVAAITAVPVGMIHDSVIKISKLILFVKLCEASNAVYLMMFSFILFYAFIVAIWVILGISRSPVSGLFERVLESIMIYWIPLILIFVILSNLSQGGWILGLFAYISEFPSFIQYVCILSTVIGVGVNCAYYINWYKNI